MLSRARTCFVHSLCALSAFCLSDCTSRGAPRQQSTAPFIPQGTIPKRNEDPLIALVDGKTITMSTLESELIEAAGNQALRDAVLDVRLKEECAAQRLEVTPALREQERALLLETLSKEPREAEDLLRKLRANLALGDARFEALLRRNAALRLLAGRDVVIDDAGMHATFDTMHGPKRRARVAALADLASAERFLASVESGRTFAEVTAELSIDPSAPRGGLLPPIAALDPSWPESVRRALFALEKAGDRTMPILDQSHYIVIEFLATIPADGVTMEAARADVERVLRRSRERILMDGLARTLSSLEGVTVFDRRFASRGH